MAFYPAQLQSYALSGAGAVAGATSITLKSFQTIDGVNLTMADFGAVGYGTLEPGNGTQEEQISFTGVVQNSNGTATLSGVKTVLFIAPFTETSGLAKTHPGSSEFVISNTSGFYGQFGALANDSEITGYWTAPDPIGSEGVANKQWVLSVVNGGPVSTDSIIVVGTAGETVAAGQLVYIKTSDSRWWLTDADTAATVENVVLGIAQGAGTAGNAITGGVLVQGVDTNQTGLSPNTVYYASNTAGGISSTPGTKEVTVGIAQSATELAFFPRFNQQVTEDELDAMAGGGTQGTPSASNQFITETGQVFKGLFSMTAGETINGATLPVPVYQDTTSNKVLACDANDLAKLKFIGFAVTNAVDTGTISVKTGGIVGGFTGLDEGVAYYVSDTVGTIQNTPGSNQVMVGVAVSTTQLLIQTGKRFANGTTSFTSTTTTAISLGFRPSRVMVYAVCDLSNGPSTSNGGWSVLGGNNCSYWGANPSDAAAALVAGVDTTAWKIVNGSGTTHHSGTITTVTDTGFTLSNTESTGAETVLLFWTAEGDF